MTDLDDIGPEGRVPAIHLDRNGFDKVRELVLGRLVQPRVAALMEEGESVTWDASRERGVSRPTFHPSSSHNRTKAA